jgi:hypothetical protein
MSVRTHLTFSLSDATGVSPTRPALGALASPPSCAPAAATRFTGRSRATIAHRRRGRRRPARPLRSHRRLTRPTGGRFCTACSCVSAATPPTKSPISSLNVTPHTRQRLERLTSPNLQQTAATSVDEETGEKRDEFGRLVGHVKVKATGA